MDQSEFAPILDAARAGAEWAWVRLYDDLAGPLRGYAVTRGASEPDDVVGEAFLQIARNLGAFEGDYPGFRSWAFVVTHNRVIDERRRRSRRRDEPVGDLPEAGDGDVEAEALESLATDRAMSVLRQLTEDQRAVVSLRIIGDLSLEQTAEVMGKRVGAVKALQRRALARLRKELPKAYPIEARERLRG